MTSAKVQTSSSANEYNAKQKNEKSLKNKGIWMTSWYTFPQRKISYHCPVCHQSTLLKIRCNLFKLSSSIRFWLKHHFHKEFSDLPDVPPSFLSPISALSALGSPKTSPSACSTAGIVHLFTWLSGICLTYKTISFTRAGTLLSSLLYSYHLAKALAQSSA